MCVPRSPWFNGTMNDANGSAYPLSRATSTQGQCFTKLRSLVASPGFVYTLAHVAFSDFFLDQEHDATAGEWRYRLSADELTLVSGLFAAGGVDVQTVPGADAHRSQVGHLRNHLQELQEVVRRPTTERIWSELRTAAAGPGGGHAGIPKFPTPADLVEPIFYSGLGAHDFQYLAMASERYRHDAEWLDENVGLSISRLTTVVEELMRLRHARAEAYRADASHGERRSAELAVLSFSRNDLPFLSDEQFNSFAERFVTVPGEMEFVPDAVGAMNDLEFKPILRIGPDRYFMPSGFHLAKSVYDNPRFWMQKDPEYADQAGANRGRATEEIAARILEPVFGNGVYRDVLIKEGRDTVTDIDILAVAGNRALVVQAKSKRLTEVARKGDERQLVKDFAQAVQDAYDQGRKSRRALLSTGYQLTDGSGRKIELPERIADVYIVCLTLEPFRGATHMLPGLLDKRTDDPYPLAISVFDLDVMAAFLGDAYEFFYYVRNRVNWSHYFRAVSEKALLGFHISENLLPREGSAFALVEEDYAHRLDADFRVLCGLQLPHPSGTYQPNWWKSDFLDEVAALLKSPAGPHLMDALFAWYDVCQSGPDMERFVVEAEHRCARTGQDTDFSLEFDGFGISYRCFPAPVWDIPEQLACHVAARKYKAGADAWLGLAGVLGTARFAVLAIWQSYPWEPNLELEQLVRVALQPGRPI